MLVKCLALCLVAIATVQGLPTSRIIGGHDALIKEFPYQVSIQYGLFWHVHICGGAVIDKHFILTAGHCITDGWNIPFFEYQVHSGIQRLNGEGQKIRVKRTIVHSNFTGGFGQNDIALLELEHPLIFDGEVAAIELPEKNSMPRGFGIISGWGSISNSSKVKPQILQAIEVPMLGHQECETDLLNLNRTEISLDDTNICTGPVDIEMGEGAAPGDSGDPFVIRDVNNRNTLVGIVTWGFYPAPTVHTRVSKYIDWIHNNTVVSDV